MLSKSINKTKFHFKNQGSFNPLKTLSRFFSSSNSQAKNYKVPDLAMPVIDMHKYMTKSEGWEKECNTLAECLHETGIVVVKDRVSFFKNINPIYREWMKKITKFL
jgi:hypothetical protein